ncbi:SOS response-associated peptidase [Aequorivita ciconiae]|nr:SOS response-associated peptidase [Aequorivita sp. H23M31]
MKSQVQEYFHSNFAFPNKFTPYYHRSGFDYPNLQIIKMDAPRVIFPAMWGYIPSWGMEDVQGFRKKYNTLNIRSETLFNGLTTQDAQDKRCLILADGFFEPHRTGGESIPYFCYIPSTSFPDGRGLFAFAGIYSELQNEPNNLNCSMLTMEANAFFRQVHNVKKRQPVVLDERLYDEWLNPHLKKKDVLELIKNGFTSKEFRAHPVSPDLYRRNIDTDKPYIIEEVPPPNLLF